MAVKLKNARTGILVPVAGVSLSVVHFPAFNGFGDGTEVPHPAPLAVQLFLSLLAQLFLRNKSGHEHSSLPMVREKYIMGRVGEQDPEPV